jgi:hypothetical protein
MFFTYFFYFLFLPTAMQSDSNDCHLIRKIPFQTRKPRPHEAKKEYPEKYCLLNLCPEKYGEIQRRVTQVYWEGKKTWREFEVEKQFDSEDDALAYSQEHKIAMDIARVITGKAQNAKAGAVIVTQPTLENEPSETYYLADKSEWENSELNQIFTIEGILRIVHHNDKIHLDINGNYSTGVVGTQQILDFWHIRDGK